MDMLAAFGAVTEKPRIAEFLSPLASVRFRSLLWSQMLRLLVTLCSLSCPALPGPATPPGPPLPLIRAQGVAPTGPAHPIFLSGNNSLVESHRGADARLSCRVRRESDYGTVSIVQYCAECTVNDTALYRSAGSGGPAQTPSWSCSPWRTTPTWRTPGSPSSGPF